MPPTRPRDAEPSVPRDLETIILRCLSKEPSRRYASAAAVADDVRRLLAAKPIDARRDSRVYVARVTSKRFVSRYAAVLLPLLLLASFLLTQNVGHWLDWHLRATHWLETWATTYVPYRPDAPFANVVVIAMRDDTDFAALAAAERLSGIDPGRVESLRRLHGRLMEKLAETGVRVVTFDIAMMADEPEFDQDFAVGAEALRSRGIGLITGVFEWPTERRRVSPAIAAVSATAPGTVQLAPDAPWAVPAVIKQPGRPALPSLALITAAWYRRPQAPASFELGNQFVEVQYDDGTPGISFPLTHVEQSFGDDEQSFITKEDMVGHCYLPMPSDDALARSVLSYQDALRAPVEQRRDWFRNKAVLVADFRSGREASEEYPDGRMLRPPLAHAAAIDMLIADTPVRHPPLVPIVGFYVAGMHLPALCAALTGTGLGLLQARHTVRRITLEVCLVLIVFALAVVAYWTSGVLWSPVLPVLQLVISAELASAVCRMANPAHSTTSWG